MGGEGQDGIEMEEVNGGKDRVREEVVVFEKGCKGGRLGKKGAVWGGNGGGGSGNGRE